MFTCVAWWRPQVKCHYLFFSKIAQPHFCSVLGVQLKQRKTYWFLSGPMGHWNLLMPAQTCNLLPIFSTESKPTTPKAQFWVSGLLLELCRQSLTICPLPPPRPPVSSVWHNGANCYIMCRLYYVAIILAVIWDLCAAPTSPSYCAHWQARTRLIWNGVNQSSPMVWFPITDWCTENANRTQRWTQPLSRLSLWR